MRKSDLERYERVIAQTQRALPGLSTAALYRIHGLLERLLESDEPNARALIELERALSNDAG